MANVFTFPEAFDNAYWSVIGGGGITPDDILSPSGTLTADRFNSNTPSLATVNKLLGFLGASNRYLSVFAKRTLTPTPYLILDIGGGAGAVVFDTSTGAVTDTDGSPTDYGHQVFSNGWNRYYMSANQSYTETFFMLSSTSTYIGRSSANGTSLYIWGAMLEAAAILNPYISGGWNSDENMGAVEAPVLSSVTPAPISNILSWTHPGGAGIQYNIYWSYLPGVTILDNKIENISSPYTHTGLLPGVTIYYVVTAYDTNMSMESAVSNEMSGIPGPPTLSVGQIIW